MRLYFLVISLFLCLACLHALELNIVEKKIQVNGKEAKIYALVQPDGTTGVRARKGESFDVTLKNTLRVPSSIHWHGLILPNNQDGVAFVTQFPLYPNGSYRYNFPLVQSGTFWMHSHYGLQEQQQLSAPLIIEDPTEARLADQDVVMLLADFTFKDPSEIYHALRCKKFNHTEMKMSKTEKKPLDLVDVDYDAFLTNSRTLQDPEVVLVKPGSRVRLRIINGSSATNFFLSLGNLNGEAIAVDGNRIQPLKGSKFELATAQRIDLIVQIPAEGAFPILAQGEGTDKQTGLILATQDAVPAKLTERAQNKVGALTNAQENQLQALFPLAKKTVDRHLVAELGGNMDKYQWTINGQSWPESTPLVVSKGERVQLTFKNSTGMSHPMHLHGHVFQVKAIDGVSLNGAMRDTVLVMPNSTLSIEFDANNPGVWPLHCHILYHLEAGMFTVVKYTDFIQPL